MPIHWYPVFDGFEPLGTVLSTSASQPSRPTTARVLTWKQPHTLTTTMRRLSSTRLVTLKSRADEDSSVSTSSSAPSLSSSTNTAATTSTAVSTASTQRLSSLPPLLVGVSTKLYFRHARTIEYVHSLVALPPRPSYLQLFFLPTFPALAPAASIIQSSNPTFSNPQLQPSTSNNSSSSSSLSHSTSILLGAQDCHWALSGAYTGSVSPLELADLHCTLVELGHAERRRPPLSETDSMVAAKATAAVQAGLVPIVCVGETEYFEDKLDREASPISPVPTTFIGAAHNNGSRFKDSYHSTTPTAKKPPVDVRASVALAMEAVSVQVSSVLSVLPETAHVIFAYEPVWAIGAAEPAPGAHICGVVQAIKDFARKTGRAGDVRVLYGGSAGPGTWKGLGGVADGLFLGRFAHEAEMLERVLKEVGKGEDGRTGVESGITEGVKGKMGVDRDRY